MQILTTIDDFRSAREKIPSGEALGLVPTMGHLHDGHLELVRHARAANGTVAVSIFVNPTQFGPDEDMLTYPRDFERDRVLLEEVGCDLLFYPAVEEMFRRSKDFFEGRALSELFPLQPDILNKIERVLESGISYRDIECEGFQKSTATPFPVSLTLSPFLNQE